MLPRLEDSGDEMKMTEQKVQLECAPGLQWAAACVKKRGPERTIGTDREGVNHTAVNNTKAH